MVSFAGFRGRPRDGLFFNMNAFSATRRFFFRALATLAGLLAYGWTNAQTPVPTTDSKLVQIVTADSTVVLVTEGQQRLIGNVYLIQGNVRLYCDLAIKDERVNSVRAYGRVRIIQADSVTVTGDTATYLGNVRQARVSGRRVTLDDRTVTLVTRRLDYDLNSRVATYNTGGTVYDKKTTLTSRVARYNTETKLVTFREEVRINSPETDLESDSLRYSTLSKEAFFIAPTKIISKDKQGQAKGDTLLTRSGSYNTATRISNFLGRSTVRTEKYDLTGDTLFYDTPTEIGLARGNVVMVAKRDSVILTGNYGRYLGKEGMTRVHGNALIKRLYTRDTLYLSADTLISEEIRTAKDTTRRLRAYRNVLIFKSDFQAKCDSLVYSLADSLMSFYRKPVIWAQGSQSEGDTILLRLVRNKLRTMYLNRRAFVISEDTLRQYNQVKGRRITSSFDDSTRIERVIVEGNGESIYYAAGEANKPIGLNRVQCSRMNLTFQSNQVKRIVFQGKPDGSLIPPHEVTEEIKYLDGFTWRETDRPTRESVMRIKAPKPPPKPTPAGQPTASSRKKGG